MALAEWILGQRARTRFTTAGEGLWIANPTRAPFGGWVNLVASCLRENSRSSSTRRRAPAMPSPSNRVRSGVARRNPRT